MIVLVEVAGSRLFFYNKRMDIKTRPQIIFLRQTATGFLVQCDIHMNAKSTWLSKDDCVFFMLETGASPIM